MSLTGRREGEVVNDSLDTRHEQRSEWKEGEKREEENHNKGGDEDGADRPS